MKRYWIIAPYNSEFKEGFEHSWKFDVEMGVVAIGWPKLGNVAGFSDDKLIEMIKQEYPKDKARSEDYIFRTFKAFYRDIKQGDSIIARKGRKSIVGVGEVVREAFNNTEMGRERYSGRGEEHIYPNFIEVDWTNKQIEFNRMVFGMQTLYETTEDKFIVLLSGREVDDEVQEEGCIEPQEFVLEKYLEDFIVSNFSSIFNGELLLLSDVEGKGQQFNTDIGTIDILAQEPKSRNYVVIELKKGRTSDVVVGQILRYMGWVKENLSKKGEDVKGLIICREKDTKLTYALKAIPSAGIDVKLYQVDFKLI